MHRPDTDRLGGMRAFAAVASRLSFVEAAGDLGLSPSALSRRIAQIERDLGCRLLQRTTRRVALTEAGALYLERCLDVLARAEEAYAEVSAISGEPRGLLRVALPNVYGQLCVAPLLPEFMRRHPRLRLEVTMEDRYVDLVEQRIDVGVRIGDLQSGDYVVRRLAPNPRRLCAAPAYLTRRGAPRTPADLSAHDCLKFSPPLKDLPWRLRRGGRTVTVTAEPLLRACTCRQRRHDRAAGAAGNLRDHLAWNGFPGNCARAHERARRQGPGWCTAQARPVHQHRDMKPKLLDRGPGRANRARDAGCAQLVRAGGMS